MADAEIPLWLKWAAGVAAAGLVLASAWDRIDKYFEARTVNKQRHDMVDIEVPKIKQLEQQTKELKELSESTQTQTKAAASYLQRSVALQVRDCEQAVISEEVCRRFFEYHDLPNTYGRSAEEGEADAHQ